MRPSSIEKYIDRSSPFKLGQEENRPTLIGNDHMDRDICNNFFSDEKLKNDSFLGLGLNLEEDLYAFRNFKNDEDVLNEIERYMHSQIYQPQQASHEEIIDNMMQYLKDVNKISKAYKDVALAKRATIIQARLLNEMILITQYKMNSFCQNS